GRDVAPVSKVSACTREIQEIHIKPEDGNEGGLTIIDFPGVSETLEKDKEYYNELAF
ncbi:TPA: hypothetical protein N6459_004125, partial [Escherichia coli]|nr:hypothetical protein [Escherichia coli]